MSSLLSVSPPFYCGIAQFKAMCCPPPVVLSCCFPCQGALSESIACLYVAVAVAEFLSIDFVANIRRPLCSLICHWSVPVCPVSALFTSPPPFRAFQCSRFFSPLPPSFSFLAHVHSGRCAHITLHKNSPSPSSFCFASVSFLVVPPRVHSV